MKRIYKNHDQARYRRRRAKREEKAKTKRKTFLKQKNAYKRSSDKQPQFSYTPTPRYDREIVAPKHFSLVNNPNETLIFISELKEAFKKKEKIFVSLWEVDIIEDDAIVILLSIMVRFKSLGIRFNGNLPSNSAARKKLEESGFLRHLYTKFDERDRYLIAQAGNDTIITHAFKNVDPALSAGVIQKASSALWGGKGRCQGVQRVLLELMLNTNNHASLLTTGDKHWWLSMSYDPVESKCKFSFVDYGVGIFDSLDNKAQGNKFYGVLNKMRSLISTPNNAIMFEKILKGELHKTATGKEYRGKGLPGIYQAFERNQISNLHILSNNVSANTSKGLYQTMPLPFDGTFLYWELTPSNQHCLAA